MCGAREVGKDEVVGRTEVVVGGEGGGVATVHRDNMRRADPTGGETGVTTMLAPTVERILPESARVAEMHRYKTGELHMLANMFHKCSWQALSLAKDLADPTCVEGMAKEEIGRASCRERV